MKKDVVAALQGTLKKRKDANTNNPVITEVTKLLEYDTLRDLDVLRSIGGMSTLVQSEAERGRMIELEKKENFFSGTVFLREQIVSLAVKYRLKLLQSMYFTSYIDPMVATDIRQLERDISRSMEAEQAGRRNVSVEEYITQNGSIDYRLDAHELKTKFYILAPAKCFKTEKRKAFSIVAPDPVMFYSADEIHFRLIRKWGSDFTVFRRIKGLLTQSKNSMFLSIAVMILAVSLGLSIGIKWNFMFIMLACIPAAMITYIPDWDKDYFGERSVSDRVRY